jgi:hypothetical protein
MDARSYRGRKNGRKEGEGGKKGRIIKKEVKKEEVTKGRADEGTLCFEFRQKGRATRVNGVGLSSGVSGGRHVWARLSDVICASSDVGGGCHVRA